MSNIDTKIQNLAARMGVPAADLRFCAEWMAGQVDNFVTEDNARDVADAYMPEFERMSDRLAVQAHTQQDAMAAAVLDAD